MEKYEKIILAVMGAVLLALIVALIVVLPGRSGSQSSGNNEKEEFKAPAFDATAIAGVPDIDAEALNYNAMKLNDDISVSACANLKVHDGNMIDPYFTSSAENNIWARLIIYDAKGTEMGSTGVIKPGEYVKSVKVKNIPSETGLIVYKIVTYEPETYYSVGTATAQVLLEIE